MKLTPAVEKYVLHWGEMGTRWGTNRTVAQIQALLYLSPRPLRADEIVDLLEHIYVWEGFAIEIIDDAKLVSVKANRTVYLKPLFVAKGAQFRDLDQAFDRRARRALGARPRH